MDGSYGDIVSSRGPPSTPLGVELKGKNWSAVTVSHNWPSGEATTSEKDATMFRHQDTTSVEVGDVSRTKARAPRQAVRPVKDSRTSVHWKLDGRPMRVTGDGADTLAVSPKRPTLSLSAISTAPPEQPSLSCYQRSPTSHIRCEWNASQPVTPVPQCHLLLRGPTTTTSCTYSKFQHRCWCVLDKNTEGSRDSYWASLCVYNTAGHVTSPPIVLHPQDIVKPDAPYNVSVRSQEGNKHWLIVSWKYPRSWKSNFYKLTFHLQYFVVLQGYPRSMVSVIYCLIMLMHCLFHLACNTMLQGKNVSGEWKGLAGHVTHFLYLASAFGGKVPHCSAQCSASILPACVIPPPPFWCPSITLNFIGFPWLPA
uniref:Type I cytokine receptor cytokine-binding domain-containing protein n=1 Tax=Paramormyrops kingsleyae TaxID=1676925 RepID=A0A3B3RNG9_9TELE